MRPGAYNDESLIEIPSRKDWLLSRLIKCSARFKSSCVVAIGGAEPRYGRSIVADLAQLVNGPNEVSRFWRVASGHQRSWTRTKIIENTNPS